MPALRPLLILASRFWLWRKILFFRLSRWKRRLTISFRFSYIAPVVAPIKKYQGWRKSRIAARLLYRKAKGPLRPRDQALARELSNDPEVENRLIQQALYCLGGSRKHDIDRKLVARGN